MWDWNIRCVSAILQSERLFARCLSHMATSWGDRLLNLPQSWLVWPFSLFCPSVQANKLSSKSFLLLNLMSPPADSLWWRPKVPCKSPFRQAGPLNLCLCLCVWALQSVFIPCSQHPAESRLKCPSSEAVHQTRPLLPPHHQPSGLSGLSGFSLKPLFLKEFTQSSFRFFLPFNYRTNDA